MQLETPWGYRAVNSQPWNWKGDQVQGRQTGMGHWCVVCSLEPREHEMAGVWSENTINVKMPSEWQDKPPLHSFASAQSTGDFRGDSTLNLGSQNWRFFFLPHNIYCSARHKAKTLKMLPTRGNLKYYKQLWITVTRSVLDLRSLFVMC